MHKLMARLTSPFPCAHTETTFASAMVITSTSKNSQVVSDDVVEVVDGGLIESIRFGRRRRGEIGGE